MNREKIIIRTSILGILANVILVIAKAIIGLIAHSVSIIMDAVNNLTDALSSIITIIGTKISNKKPDKKHPFGHGRVEYLTSMIIGVIVLIAGVTAIYESINALINKTTPNYNYISIIIVSIAIVIKIGIGIYYRAVGKKIKSEAILGSGLDALFDAILSLGTLIGIIVYLIWNVAIEGYLGIIIGLFIIKGGIGILKSSLSQIIGERTSPETVKEVKKVVLSFDEVKGAYDLILNNYGPEKTIGSIHIEVDDNMTAKDIHQLSRKVTEKIYLEFGIIMTVGIYASNTYDDKLVSLRKRLNQIIKSHPEVLQIHGFYLDQERNTVTFDLIIDFKESDPAKIKNQIIEEIAKDYPEYHYYVVLDDDFS